MSCPMGQGSRQVILKQRMKWFQASKNVGDACPSTSQNSRFFRALSKYNLKQCWPAVILLHMTDDVSSLLQIGIYCSSVEAKEIWSHCLLVICFLKPLLPFVYPFTSWVSSSTRGTCHCYPLLGIYFLNSTSLTVIFNDAVHSFIVEKVQLQGCLQHDVM